jgi:hypothetical protein
VDVRSELVALCLPTHRGDDSVADDERTNVAPFGFGDEPLDQNVLLGALQGLDDRFGDPGVRSEDDADSLGALQQFDDDRRTSDPVDGRQHVLTVPHEGGGGDADVVSGEDLDRAELVAGVGDAGGGVRGVDVHLFELADDRQTEERDRGSDPGQNGVVVAERLSAVLQRRLFVCEVDGEAQRVEDPHLVAAVDRRGPETLGAVHVGGA